MKLHRWKLKAAPSPSDGLTTLVSFSPMCRTSDSSLHTYNTCGIRASLANSFRSSFGLSMVSLFCSDPRILGVARAVIVAHLTTNDSASFASVLQSWTFSHSSQHPRPRITRTGQKCTAPSSSKISILFADLHSQNKDCDGLS